MTQIRLEIDLSKVHNYDVYELPRSPDEKKKTFSCSIEVSYEIAKVTKSTDTFVIVGGAARNPTRPSG